MAARVLPDHYVVGPPLGEEGFGTLYESAHSVTGRRTVHKVFEWWVVGLPEAMKQIQQEASHREGVEDMFCLQDGSAWYRMGRLTPLPTTPVRGIGRWRLGVAIGVAAAVGLGGGFVGRGPRVEHGTPELHCPVPRRAVTDVAPVVTTLPVPSPRVPRRTAAPRRK